MHRIQELKDFCFNSRFLRLYLSLFAGKPVKKISWPIQPDWWICHHFPDFSKFLTLSQRQSFDFSPVDRHTEWTLQKNLLSDSSGITTKSIRQMSYEINHSVAKASSILWSTANCLARPTYFFGRPLLVLYWILIDIQLFAWSQYFYLLAVSTP